MMQLQRILLWSGKFATVWLSQGCLALLQQTLHCLKVSLRLFLMLCNVMYLII